MERDADKEQPSAATLLVQARLYLVRSPGQARLFSRDENKTHVFRARFSYSRGKNGPVTIGITSISSDGIDEQQSPSSYVQGYPVLAGSYMFYW